MQITACVLLFAELQIIINRPIPYTCHYGRQYGVYHYIAARVEHIAIPIHTYKKLNIKQHKPIPNTLRLKPLPGLPALLVNSLFFVVGILLSF